MSTDILFGNMFGFLCGLLCMLSTFGKTHKQVMLLQSLNCLCGIISNVILKGYSGALTLTVCLLRNVFVYKDKCSKLIRMLLLVILIALGTTFNNRGLLGLLPITASAEYTIIITRTKSVKVMNTALLINSFLWLVYELITLNYMNAILELMTIIASGINIIRCKN